MWLHASPMDGAPVFLIIWVLPWVILLAMAVRTAARWRWRGRCRSDATDNSSSPRSACELLDQRYARGEIDREQYLKMKEDLH
jgi:putative membrane protein